VLRSPLRHPRLSSRPRLLRTTTAEPGAAFDAASAPLGSYSSLPRSAPPLASSPVAPPSAAPSTSQPAGSRDPPSEAGVAAVSAAAAKSLVAPNAAPAPLGSYSNSPPSAPPPSESPGSPPSGVPLAAASRDTPSEAVVAAEAAAAAHPDGTRDAVSGAPPLPTMLHPSSPSALLLWPSSTPPVAVLPSLRPPVARDTPSFEAVVAAESAAVPRHVTLDLYGADDATPRKPRRRSNCARQPRPWLRERRKPPTPSPPIADNAAAGAAAADYSPDALDGIWTRTRTWT